MTETVPIRVSLETRDMLRMIARDEHLTIPGAISKVVNEALWQRAFAAERLAQLHDEANPAALAEDASWDAVSDEAIMRVLTTP